MTQRFRLFLVVLMLMFVVKFFGQNIPQMIKYDPIYQPGVVNLTTIRKNVGSKNFQTFNYVYKHQLSFYTYKLVKPAEIICLKDYYLQNLGSICRMEYKIQKVISVPLRFRIGSLDYTNYLEQKPNALKPN